MKRAVPAEDAIVLATMSRFGIDHAALERFVDATGLDLRAIRTGLSDGSLQAGLMHYLAGDEALLVGVAADLDLPPAVLAEAIMRDLSPDLEQPVSAGSATRGSASAPRVRPRG